MVGLVRKWTFLVPTNPTKLGTFSTVSTERQAARLHSYCRMCQSVYAKRHNLDWDPESQTIRNLWWHSLRINEYIFAVMNTAWRRNLPTNPVGPASWTTKCSSCVGKYQQVMGKTANHKALVDGSKLRSLMRNLILSLLAKLQQKQTVMIVSLL